MQAARFTHPIDGCNVWMVQSGGGACFTFESSATPYVCGEICGEDFHGDSALQLQVAAEIHASHPARSNLAHQFILVEGFAYDWKTAAWGAIASRLRFFHGRAS